ncbi:MAG TPA: hypothetical protein EYP41_00585 [Anaerolineae bacterium]|nr:hypothetical protein [Anaerolineae bacterium]HIP72867.1 hypothetical protein [Anaerolineae bacterium]
MTPGPRRTFRSTRVVMVGVPGTAVPGVAVAAGGAGGSPGSKVAWGGRPLPGVSGINGTSVGGGVMGAGPISPNRQARPVNSKVIAKKRMGRQDFIVYSFVGNWLLVAGGWQPVQAANHQPLAANHPFGYYCSMQEIRHTCQLRRGYDWGA